MRRAWVLLLVTALAACGGNGGGSRSGDTLPEPTVTIDGEWVATSLTVGGTVIELDANAPVTMAIDDAQVTGVAACNSYGGTLRLDDDGTFALADLAVTEMACEPARIMVVEQAVLAAFGTLTRYELTSELVLTSADDATAMTLVRSVAATLDGAWRAISASVDGAEVAGLDTVTVTMAIGAGRMTGSSGCNDYDVQIDVTGDAVAFGGRSATEAFCTAAPGEIEALFGAVTTGSATWAVGGDTLTLTNGDSMWVFERLAGPAVATTVVPTVEPPGPTTSPPGLAGPVPAVEIRPVGSCFPVNGEGPAPDQSAGQAVLSYPDTASRCMVGPPIGPAPVLVPPLSVTIEPATGTWSVKAAVRSEARLPWDQLVQACYERSEPCAAGQIAVVVDGAIVTAPTVVIPQIPGDVQLTGDFTESEARALADALERDDFGPDPAGAVAP